MKCLILAAGYATRLYPLTENFPKPLLKIQGRSILDWLLDDLGAATDIDQFIVVSNHKFADIFRDWAMTKALPITVVDDGTSTNETRLGAVKDILFAVNLLSIDDDLLVIAGDNVLDFSLGSFVDFAREKGTSCTMRSFEPDSSKLHKFGISEIDENDRLLSFEEKPAAPRSHWATPPFYFYTAADVAKIGDAVNDGCGTDAPGSLVAWMCKHSTMHSMKMPGDRYDIGNLKSYEEVQRTFRGIKAIN